MKKLSNTEAEMKNALVIKKRLCHLSSSSISLSLIQFLFTRKLKVLYWVSHPGYLPTDRNPQTQNF